MSDETPPTLPTWAGACIALGIAALIAIAVGALTGAITGWSVGHWGDFILEQHERAREAPGGLKRYVWVRTMHFALPMGVGGYAALRLMNRYANAQWPAALLPLAIGAFIGWLTARGTLSMTAPDAVADLASTLLAPAALFLVIPLIKIVKES